MNETALRFRRIGGEYVEEDFKTDVQLDLPSEVSVMTYNVLAQCYVRSSFFPYCQKDALKWKNRSKMLMEQIKAISPRPDIICLQECDLYEEFWLGEMKALDYLGLYKKKSGTKQDGVAVFWQESKFSLVGKKEIDINELCDQFLTDSNLDLISRAKRDTVALFVQLKWNNAKDDGEEFIVGTTHLFWDPAQADVKLLQARIVLNELESMKNPTMILCGDFNSLPGSEVYQLIIDSGWSSAYSLYGPLGEPSLTTASGQTEKEKLAAFCGTLDYIFYKKHSFKPTHLRDLMTLENATQAVALPSAVHGSDHLPLVCNFRRH